MCNQACLLCGKSTASWLIITHATGADRVPSQTQRRRLLGHPRSNAP